MRKVVLLFVTCLIVFNFQVIAQGNDTLMKEKRISSFMSDLNQKEGIFPVPFENSLTARYQKAEIEIFNLLGKSMFAGKIDGELSVETSSSKWYAGIYIVTIKFPGDSTRQTITQKLFKQ